MTKVNKHSSTQSTGFDFQLYYCIYRLLCIGEDVCAVGYEDQDDVHVELSNGTIELCQVKHSNDAKNLTDSSDDLWKTLYIWTDQLPIPPSQKYKFVFVTNRPNESQFVKNILKYQQKNISDISNLKNDIQTLNSNSKSVEKKGNIIEHRKKIESLDNDYFMQLFEAFSYEFIDDIESKCKQKIAKRFVQPIDSALIDRIFNDLCSNILSFKNSEKGKFRITFDEFTMRFRRIFYPQNPKRSLHQYHFSLPSEMEKQTFVKQLDEIDYWFERNDEIIDFTTRKINAINNINEWVKIGEMLPREYDICIQSAQTDWKNRFRKYYREYRNQEPLEQKHNEIARNLVNDVLQIDGKFDINDTDFNNGIYWMLSDEPIIGWRKDWEKYKTKSR